MHDCLSTQKAEFSVKKSNPKIHVKINVTKDKKNTFKPKFKTIYDIKKAILNYEYKIDQNINPIDKQIQTSFQSSQEY